MRITGLLCVALGIVVCSRAAASSPLGPSVPAANTQRARAARPRLVVVVHRAGGRVAAGDSDDARRWVSHTVKTTGRSAVTLPAFEGTDAEWRGMLSCTRAQYRGLPVDFVESPPATGDYLLAVVGGSARTIGQTKLWGLASAGSRAVVPKGVGFVFSADHRVKDRAAALCVTLTHEVGHMLGLKHSADCTDVMSTAVDCQRREAKYERVRGFRQENWSVLGSSLAAWAKRGNDQETRIVDQTNDKAQTTRALVVP